jgi:hypothetical protein
VDPRDTTAAVTDAYTAAADDAIAEAERVRARWAERGDTEGAALAERLQQQLVASRDDARRGTLPPRNGGFPLTRFVGEYDWGPDADGLVDRVYALQRIWEGRV